MDVFGTGFLVLGLVTVAVLAQNAWERHVSYPRREAIVEWFWIVFVGAFVLVSAWELVTTGRVSWPSFDYPGP